MNNDLLIDDILTEKARSEILSLPEDLNLKIKQTLTSLPVRKKKKMRFLKIATAAVVIILVTSFVLSAAFPAYARNVPVLSSIFQFLSENNLIDKDYVEYSSDLNLSKTSNNATVTINSIVYDGIDLSIAYTVESKEEMGNEPHIRDKDFRINGKITSFGSGGAGTFINKNTYVGVDSFQVSHDYLPKEIRKHILGGDVNIPDNFIMDLDIKQFSDGTTGKWDFKFKVSLDKIKGKVKQVKTSINLSKMRAGLKVNEVIFTPINTVLRTVVNNTNSDDMIQYIAFDDKGRSLLCKGANGEGDNNNVYWQYTFRNIYDDTKSVTFIPLVNTNDYNEKTKNTKEWDRKVVTQNLTGTTVLSEGRFGEYKINKIELFDDKTMIYYECSNLLPAIAPYGLFIMDENDNFLGLQKEILKDQGDNKFIAQIDPLTKNKKYTLMAVDLEKEYDIREDLKFTIKVK